MIYRRDKNHRNFKNKNLFISIISLVLVLGLSLVIANNLALSIYKGSNYEKSTNYASDNEIVLEDKNDNKYANELSEDSLIMFQGGVFEDLENAEEFKDNIEDKTLASIVNDGKYERIILGVANKENFSDMVDMLKKNNIQFVKQVYRIPVDIEYNSEILKIVDLFVNFVLMEFENLSGDEFDTYNLKKQVTYIKADYGKVGSYREFNDFKELILELDDKSSKEDLEGVVDFIYFNFKEYRV